MKSGVYTITNLVNGKIYVGYTYNIEKRGTRHFNDLRLNKHANRCLQRAFNKYTEENFKFEILVECSKYLLASEEHYWATLLKVHDRNFGYNIKPTHPDGLKRHSEETRKRISRANKNKNGKIVYQYDLQGNFIKKWDFIMDAANTLGVKASNISLCLNTSYNGSIGGYFWRQEFQPKIVLKNKRFLPKNRKVL